MLSTAKDNIVSPSWQPQLRLLWYYNLAKPDIDQNLVGSTHCCSSTCVTSHNHLERHFFFAIIIMLYTELGYNHD